MGNDVHNEEPNEANALAYSRDGTSDFWISRQTDGCWEMEHSLGNHKRIYQSLIDATEGALDAAATNPGPYSIRITR